jgi:hypothetical protein
MKRLFTLTLLVLVLGVVQSFSATKWEFVKVFPDTTLQVDGNGMHGIAVDPLGRVWIAPYGAIDSIFDVVAAKYVVCRPIYIYNANGTKASFSPIRSITIGGKTDTLYNSTRGMKADKDGNIVYTSYDVYYKIDYRTGAGIAKVQPTVGGYGVAAAFDDANEMFTGYVLPSASPMKFYDASFNYVGNVDTQSLGYSRCIEVSKDGNSVYWTTFTLGKVYVYTSPDHTLLPYAITDSMANGIAVESTCWNSRDGYCYMSGGNPLNPPSAGPWSVNTWYAFDMTNYTVQDSIKFNDAAYPYGTGTDNSPRPRGIAFTTSGDTAYVCMFNLYTRGRAGVQMFRRVPVSVENIDNVIPNGFELSQNYPNPFNPSTEIRFTVANAGFTTIKVYSVLGEEVASLVNENLAVGSYKTTFDAAKLSSGTYIYTLTSGNTHISKKMLLVK